MKKLSGFDIGMIAAFVVILLLGGGAWYYLSGQLQTAQQDVSNAKTDFDRLSIAKFGNESIVVSPTASQTLQGNITLLTGELSPLIQSKLLGKDNKLASISNKDPVTWKHELDDDVAKLAAAAKLHNVAIKPSFYFGFSYYLSRSPGDQQTAVLSKQLLSIDQISTILINAPVKSISYVRRTYEEDRPTGGNGAPNNTFNQAASSDPDRLGGFSVAAPGDVYEDYPFEFEFDVAPENLRTVMDELLKSPYVFVVRTLTIRNDHPDSAHVTDLQKIAGTPSPSNLDTPGATASTTSTKGPQFLFGSALLHVRARIDLIDWTDTSLVTNGGAASNNASLTSPGN